MKINSQLVVVVVCLLLSATSCNRGPKLEPLDLLTHGLPLKISAPAGVEIKMDDLGIMKDMTVKNNEGFSLQIFESETSELDAKKVNGRILEEVKANQYFSKLISETETGFIYEKKIDEDYINYDFRIVKVRGDKQYVIQTGLSNQYTLEQVKIMFKAVQ